ncbi:hypothetical protein KVR01_012757 [Diaporthe batatas]|uniref:uncharacterized protein n=1 Tax=Diaporthe batatas TaxID=748121 RepID=UPI001D0425BE|nr:uncharacterized protein KVR01_012757 [Diaporthe batatas]KAG8157373.1 hypothetical protein KVR01_012757 [Diaporthe batatas]
MSHIYSDAYLVLAAASADADDKGFFTQPRGIYRGLGLESRVGSGEKDLVMHTFMPHPKSRASARPLSPIDFGPLGTRAWTLQETLLARRCVGFNENEIAWECRSFIDSLAHIIAEASGDEYIAGIWRGDIMYGLAWMAAGSSRRTETAHSPHNPPHPSFSWASVDGPIEYLWPTNTMEDDSSSTGSFGVSLLE